MPQLRFINFFKARTKHYWLIGVPEKRQDKITQINKYIEEKISKFEVTGHNFLNKIRSN